MVEGAKPWPIAEVGGFFVAVSLILSSIEPARNDNIKRLYGWTMVFILVLALYVVFQLVPWGAFANPIWSDITRVLNVTVPSTISVAPGEAPWALFRMLLPFAVFLAGLFLLQYENEAEWIWRSFCWLGAAFAVYGVLQLLLFPNWLLFSEKTAYVNSLTSVLVNRNNAATFLGMTLIASLCLLRWETRSRVRSGFWYDPRVKFGRFYLSRMVIVLWCIIAFQVLALGLTTSRGGLAATFVASIFVVFLLDFHVLRGTLANRIAIWFGIVIVSLVLVDLIGGKTLFRLGGAGADARFCIFSATFEAALVNMPFGTGLGSFQDVFPSFRESGCSILGVVDMAHNSYLENLLELGLPFVGFLIVGLSAVLAILLKGYRGRREYRPFVVGGFGILMLVGLHAMVDFSMQIPAVACFFALMLASSITMSLGRKAKVAAFSG